MTSDYTLAYGTHPDPHDGRCAMEWVAQLAGERHSDQPECVSPVVRALCVALNDGLRRAERQRLRPYLTRTIGTAGDGLDELRAWIALDWLIGVYAPTWLRAVGLHDAADRLREPGAVEAVDARTLGRGLERLERARREARLARQEAFGDSVHWALAVARGETGSESAWSFTAAGAWGAARLAIADLGAERACGAVRAIAGDCAAIAARRARRDPTARRALRSRPSVGLALAPVLDELTDSAIELLDRMLPTILLPDAPASASRPASAPTPPHPPAAAPAPELAPA